MNDVLAPWRQAWDAYLETLGSAAEGTLTSPEFLRLQRRTLDLLCGHRELWLKAMAEMAGRPHNPGEARHGGAPPRQASKRKARARR